MREERGLVVVMAGMMESGCHMLRGRGSGPSYRGARQRGDLPRGSWDLPGGVVVAPAGRHPEGRELRSSAAPVVRA